MPKLFLYTVRICTVKIVYGDHAGKLGRVISADRGSWGTSHSERGRKFRGGRIDTAADKKWWVEIDDPEAAGGTSEIRVESNRLERELPCQLSVDSRPLFP
jgi:hypothetical protein